MVSRDSGRDSLAEGWEPANAWILGDSHFQEKMPDTGPKLRGWWLRICQEQDGIVCWVIAGGLWGLRPVTQRTLPLPISWPLLALTSHRGELSSGLGEPQAP